MSAEHERSPGTDRPRTRRLFFALWPDDLTRQSLAHATRKAVRGSGGKPVPVSNLHATAAFLGSIDESRLPALLAVGEAVAPDAFTLTLDKVEHWPRQGILCAMAAERSLEAEALAARLRDGLLAAGFAPDLKPFRPHLTLARKVIKPHALGPITPVEWPIDALALVESETDPAGSRYTVIRRWPP